MIDYPSQQGDVGDYLLINYYVILLRMRTHSCIIVGIVEEKGKNTVLGRKRLGKDFLSKKGRQTHTSAGQKERL